MIELRDVTKRYKSTTAVENLSFTVEPVHITGFLGPNGAGQTTTMRLILGLDNPTAGTVTVNGQTYRDKRAPPRASTIWFAIVQANRIHGDQL